VSRLPRAMPLALVVAVSLGACQPQGTTKTITLETLNDSGVTGTVTLTELDSARTRVVVSVDPAGHSDMPAHIHPGSCEDLVPQPRYALANVVDGESTTEVPAALSELLAGDVAVNLHRSNTEMDVYTACAVLE
jgi:hypothetical protein